MKTSLSRFTLALVISFAVDAAHAQLITAPVTAAGRCPPNGYPQGDPPVKRAQPAYDTDADGDGTKDAWDTPVQIPKAGGGNYSSTDAAGNKICLPAIGDPRGAGCGRDYFSPRFKKGGVGPGIIVGRCHYTYGRNSWKVSFEDQDGNCVPDKFTKITWDSRDGGSSERTSDCYSPTAGQTTSYVTDLTKDKIAAAKTCPAGGNNLAGPSPQAFFIADVQLFTLGADLSALTLDGQPLPEPEGPYPGAVDRGQEITSPTVVHTLTAQNQLAMPGGLIRAVGYIQNNSVIAHFYRVAVFGLNAEIATPPSELIFTIQPGQARTYQLEGFVANDGPAALVAYAYAETGVLDDNALDAAIFDVPPGIVIEQQPQNVVVTAGETAVFTVGAVAQGAPQESLQYQWFRDGVTIAGATQSSYTTALLTFADSGAAWSCAVSLPNLDPVVSDAATATVIAESVPPMLVSARTRGRTNQIILVFNEPVSPQAASLFNYSLSGGATLSAVTLQSNQTSVVLTTSPLAPGGSYVVTVNNVTDLSGNPIAPNSQIAVDTSVAAVSNFTFGQLDWYNDAGVLLAPNSSWGVFEFDLVPHGQDFFYLNIVANAAGTNAWVVRNLPLFPDRLGNGSLRQGADFNIASLGVAAGVDLTSMNVLITVRGDIQTTAPVGPLTLAPVTDVTRFAFGGELLGPVMPANVGQPGEVDVKAEPEDVIQHRDVRAVQETNYHCLYGSFARSMDWLNRTYGLGNGSNAQQIYEEIVRRAVPVGPGSYQTNVARKARYLEEIAQPKIAKTKILDLQNGIPAVEGVPEETGIDLIDWLNRELPTEDAELHYANHIVTVTGIYRVGTNYFVRYRDDEKQSDPARGDTAEKTGSLKKVGGNYVFRADTNFEAMATFLTVQLAISESICEPYAVDNNGNVTWSGNRTDVRPIRDAVPPHGGRLSFYWTSGQFTPGQAPRAHPRYQRYEETNNTAQAKQRQFHRPNDNTITDWYQQVTSSNGTSVVYGGNIQRSSPWVFRPLSELPDIPWRIPDLAPRFGISALKIYTAVNLERYFTANPNGFLGGAWSPGQTLNELGLTIVDGQIPGLEGIIWATTDFTFDPNSATGWVPIGGPAAWLDSAAFQAAHDDIQILAQHEGVMGVPAPNLMIVRHGATLLLTFPTVTGATYTVERSTSLTGWQFFQAVTGTGGRAEIPVEASQATEFFRLRTP